VSGSYTNLGNNSFGTANVYNGLNTFSTVQFIGLTSASQDSVLVYNTDTGQVHYTASSAFTPVNPDLSNFALLSGSNSFSGDQVITDSNGAVALRATTANRELYDNTGVVSHNWHNRILKDNLAIDSIAYQARELRDESSTAVLLYSGNKVRMPHDVQMTGLSQTTTDSVISINTATGQLSYTLTSSLNSLSSSYAEIAATASYIDPTFISASAAASGFGSGGGSTDISALNAFTSSIQSEVNSLTAATSSYVLNSVTSSMLAPYVLTSSTSSMSVLSSSYATTASYATVNLQQVTDLGATTTNDINVNSIGVWDGANGEHINIGTTDGGIFISSSVYTFTNQSDNLTFGQSGVRTVSLSSLNVTGAKTYELPNESGTIALVSGSVFGTASYATTASYYQETDPIFVAKSGSFATTGSNQFKANQFVTGSVTATSFTGSLRGHVTTSSIDTTQYKLIGSTGTTAINWETGIVGHPDTRSIDWVNRQLINGYNVASINWGSHVLNDINGDTIVDYSTRRKLSVIGGVTTKLGSVFHSALNDTESFWSGEIDEWSANANKLGQLVYLDNTGEWQLIDQTTNTSANYLGIAISEDKVLTEGYIRMADGANPYAFAPIYLDNPIIGKPVYIIEGGDGTETNSYSCTLPSSGYIRVLGHVVSRGDTLVNSYMIKLKPSNDWYEI